MWFNLELWEPDGVKEASAPWRDWAGKDSTRDLRDTKDLPNRMVIEIVARGSRLRIADGRGGFKEVNAADGVLLETWSLSRTWVSPDPLMCY